MNRNLVAIVLAAAFSCAALHAQQPATPPPLLPSNNRPHPPISRWMRARPSFA